MVEILYTKEEYDLMVKNLNYKVDQTNNKSVIKTGKTLLLLHKLNKKDHNTRILKRKDFLKIRSLTFTSSLKPYSIVGGVVVYD